MTALRSINEEAWTQFKIFFEEIDSIRLDEEVRDNSKYEHPLFVTIQDILLQLDKISFKEASTLIGRSLVNEFSELDSSDSAQGDDPSSVSAPFPLLSLLPVCGILEREPV